MRRRHQRLCRLRLLHVVGIHDSVQLENAGVPTATMVTDEFLVLAKTESLTRGLGDLRLIELPHPVGFGSSRYSALTGGVKY